MRSIFGFLAFSAVILISCSENKPEMPVSKAKTPQGTYTRTTKKIEFDETSKKLLGYWYFDSILINGNFSNKPANKKHGFAFEYDRSFNEIDKMERSVAVQRIGQFRISSDSLIIFDNKGDLEFPFVIEKLTDSKLVLSQNAPGRNRVFVCLKDLEKEEMMKKIYGPDFNK